MNDDKRNYLEILAAVIAFSIGIFLLFLKTDPLLTGPPMENLPNPWTLEFEYDDYLNKPFVKNVPIFEWTEVSNAKHYEFQLSREPHFSKIIHSQSVKKPFYKWMSLMPGQFYWRVRTRFSDQKLGPFSVGKECVFKLPAPSVTAHLPIAMRNLSSFDNKVHVSIDWPEVPMSSGYEIWIKHIVPDENHNSNNNQFSLSSQSPKIQTEPKALPKHQASSNKAIPHIEANQNTDGVFKSISEGLRDYMSSSSSSSSSSSNITPIIKTIHTNKYEFTINPNTQFLVRVIALSHYTMGHSLPSVPTYVSNEEFVNNKETETHKATPQKKPSTGEIPN